MLIKMLQMTNHDNYGERLFAPSITNLMEMMRNDENLGNGKFLKFLKHLSVGRRGRRYRSVKKPSTDRSRLTYRCTMHTASRYRLKDSWIHLPYPLSASKWIHLVGPPLSLPCTCLGWPKIATIFKDSPTKVCLWCCFSVLSTIKKQCWWLRHYTLPTAMVWYEDLYLTTLWNSLHSILRVFIIEPKI